MNNRLLVLAVFLFTSSVGASDVCTPGEIFRTPGRADIGSTAVAGDTAFILTTSNPEKLQRLVQVELATGLSEELMNWQIDSDTFVNEIASDGTSLLYTRWNRGVKELWVMDLATRSAARLMAEGAPSAVHISGPYVYGLKRSTTIEQNGRAVWLANGELIRVPLVGGTPQTLASALILDYNSDLTVKDAGIFVLARDGIHRITKDGASPVYAGSNLQSLVAADDDTLWFASLAQLSSYAHGGVYEVQIWRLDPLLRPRLFASMQVNAGMDFPGVSVAVLSGSPGTRVYTVIQRWVYVRWISTVLRISYESGGTIAIDMATGARLLAGRRSSVYSVESPPEGTWMGRIVRTCVPPDAPARRRAVQ